MAEPPPPVLLGLNRPHQQLPLVALVLIGQASPEWRRRSTGPLPGAGARGAGATGHPEPRRNHPEVALGLLYLPHPGPLAVGEPSHRKPAGAAPCRPPLFPPSGQGPFCKAFNFSSGLAANFYFLFVFKNSKIVKSIINRREMGKLQTQLF